MATNYTAYLVVAFATDKYDVREKYQQSYKSNADERTVGAEIKILTRQTQ